MTPYEDIAPYTDEEAVAALKVVADHPNTPWVSKYIFSNQPETYLRDILKSIRSVDEFQKLVMSQAIEWVIEKSVHNFSYDGLAKLQAIDGCYLAMSNHRDIILDPAFTQIILHRNQMPLTEICVGDNLLKSKTIEGLIRSNRMIKVIRGISARELYLSSQVLSKYIRESITTGKSSVWIAQREGRTKNGIDMTEQGLLKMFDMSGTGDFVENFLELNIVPLSISYEYEPCDILKAREILISRTQKYVKTENEDLQSIIIGIKQQKGNVHLNFGDPLKEDEIREASVCDKNDRYRSIRHAVDVRVINGYRLWNTNYIAYDLANHTFKYADRYTPEEVEAFTAYTEHQLDQVEPTLNREELRDIFLRIYGNPVMMKEKFNTEG
ncbi:MAG: acyltransferase [Bacteroidales bacterium]|nr:acyltransferase [Bacteroidales bacterium]